MKERPILFSGAMVRAILQGEKTQTRRVVKPQPTRAHVWYGCEDGTQFWTDDAHQGEKGNPEFRKVPYGTACDQLWVRETWAEDGSGFTYRATNETWPHHWAPSIFMPRKASRITLEVVKVRVERLQDISEDDARAEGVDQEFRTVVMSPLGVKDYHMPLSYRAGYANLWDEINGVRAFGWDANPWVWVIEFRRIDNAL